MVRLKVLLFILIFSLQMLFAEVSVNVRWDSALIAGKPLLCSLVIRHADSENIDPESFTMKGEALKVELTETKPVDDKHQESTFSFTVPAKESGLYILPSIHFAVNGQIVATDGISYEVITSTPSLKKEAKASLQLEDFVEKQGTLYPGQTVVAGYRYIYNDTMELTKEELPLLNPDGFSQLGRPVARSFRRGNFMVRELRQTLKAEVPGQYQTAPSYVEGYVYRASPGGKKRYVGEKLIASAPSRILEITAFPKEGRPASFYGAIGTDLTIQSSVKGFTDLELGNTISVTLLIAGVGEVENAPIPKLCCQPGFVGRIEEADIPAVETFSNGKKYIVIDLKPLSTSVKEIPSIEYSFFNPDTKTYTTVRSDPIQITVTAREGVEEIAPSSASTSQNSFFWEKPDNQEKQQEDQLKEEGTSLFSVVFVILALGIVILVAFFALNRRRKDPYKDAGVHLPVKSRSEELFERALQIRAEASFIEGLQNAFITRLVEMGEISSVDTSVENLPDSGNSKKVKEFFATLQNARFSSATAFNREEVGNNALELFHRFF